MIKHLLFNASKLSTFRGQCLESAGSDYLEVIISSDDNEVNDHTIWLPVGAQRVKEVVLMSSQNSSTSAEVLVLSSMKTFDKDYEMQCNANWCRFGVFCKHSLALLYNWRQLYCNKRQFPLNLHLFDYNFNH